MIRFILNNKEINTDLPPGLSLLDFIRYNEELTGTKIGCREGDCGACTILTGEIKDDGKLKYRSATSCLTALGNIHHKHVVTVEGINLPQLNPIQHAICDENATQCGFCTPGFVVSLAGFCLDNKTYSYQNAIAAVDGNICRCTGYKSIERAAAIITDLMNEKKPGDHLLEFLTSRNILPPYFNSIRDRLVLLSAASNGIFLQPQLHSTMLSGGTDLYVQKHEEMVDADINFLFNKNLLKYITEENNRCVMGGAVTVTDLIESGIIQKAIPAFNEFSKLVSSTPIRNIATIAGNFVNASPIGDFSILFLALDAVLTLTDGIKSREIHLRDFYKSYKTLDKKPNEAIEKISFRIPAKNTRVNFEKVSKRTYLDIASVNTAISITVNDHTIADASISAGGVAPVPIFLTKTSAFLKGKDISTSVVHETIRIAKSEISPISDARGTAIYKRFLLGQLIKSHFITLFPELEIDELLEIKN